MEEKLLHIYCAQLCINSYGGEYGKVWPVLKDAKRYEIGHTQFDVGNDGKYLFICFEGSHGGQDWKDNLEFKQSPLTTPYQTEGPIRVHYGFYSQYQVVRGKIHEIIRQWMETELLRGVVITGHSLGGALATLCAVDLDFNFQLDIQCVTFGSPRVGNRAFAKSFNRRIPKSTRYVYKNDMVTKVPMAYLFYYHVDKEAKLGTREWYRPLSFALGNPLDHYPQKYKDALTEEFKAKNIVAENGPLPN